MARTGTAGEGGGAAVADHPAVPPVRPAEDLQSRLAEAEKRANDAESRMAAFEARLSRILPPDAPMPARPGDAEGLADPEALPAVPGTLLELPKAEDPRHTYFAVRLEGQEWFTPAFIVGAPDGEAYDAAADPKRPFRRPTISTARNEEEIHRLAFTEAVYGPRVLTRLWHNADTGRSDQRYAEDIRVARVQRIPRVIAVTLWCPLMEKFGARGYGQHGAYAGVGGVPMEMGHTPGRCQLCHAMPEKANAKTAKARKAIADRFKRLGKVVPRELAQSIALDGMAA